MRTLLKLYNQQLEEVRYLLDAGYYMEAFISMLAIAVYMYATAALVVFSVLTLLGMVV